MRDGVAEGFEFAIEIVQFADAALQVPVQRLDLLFRAPASLNGFLQFRVLPLELLRLIPQQCRFAVEFHEYAHLGAQNFGHERLGEIVHRAQSVSAANVLFAAAERGQKDNGRMPRALALANERGGFEAIHIGHHDVEHDHGEIVLQKLA